MKTLEFLFILVSTGMFTLSAVSAIILGPKSQIPRPMVALVSVLSVVGIIVLFTR